jgi:hypothetical protein
MRALTVIEGLGVCDPVEGGLDLAASGGIAARVAGSYVASAELYALPYAAS